MLRPSRSELDDSQALPGSDARAATLNRRLIIGTLTLILVAEALVAVLLSPVAGAIMFAFTGLLGVLEHRGERFAAGARARTMEAYASQKVHALASDMETGLPNRQALLDQLTRDIARAERYREDLTMAVIEIGQFDAVQARGRDVRNEAIAHVAQTLKRVTRTSDYIARIDERRFAVLLIASTAAQAEVFAERAVMAVANRPLSAGHLPVYINCEVEILGYDAAQYRGPLAFLSAAGGDAATTARKTRKNPAGTLTGDGGQSLRRQILGTARAANDAERYAHLRKKAS
ncbi:MAG: GGDEF domain-containing protein [Dehalococcoidia bacterium]